MKKSTQRTPWWSAGFLLIEGAFLLSRVLPLSVFLIIGRGIVSLYTLVGGNKLRRAGLRSLEIAYGDSLSLKEKKKLVVVSTRNLAEGLMGHVYTTARRSASAANRYFTIENEERLAEALARRKGAVIAIGHLGPFSWMLHRFAGAGYPLSIVMRPTRVPTLTAKMSEELAHCGQNTILSVPVKGCVSDSLKALSRNEIVFFPIDQNYGGSGRIFTKFFGRPAATAPGPVLFAVQAGAPLFFAHAVPTDRQRFKIVISPEFKVPQGVSSKEANVMLTGELTAYLERLIRQYPDQWSWMHARWKTVPKEGEM